MTAHKHAKVIKAKADNMDLVVFVRTAYGGDWVEVGAKEYLPSFHPDNEYFLCLPQHKDAVLNLLNGGRSQVNYGEYWSECNCNEPIHWFDNWWYMDSKCESRIKPRKERRWICITDNLEIEDGTLYDSYADADENSPGYKQIVEIEVEV